MIMPNAEGTDVARDLDRRFSDQLKAGGLYSQSELERTVKLAKRRRMSLPETAVATGLLTEDQVGTLLGSLLCVPFVFPSKESIDRDLFSVFPEELLRLHMAVPVCREGDVVNLATSEVSSFATSGDFKPEVRREFEAACGSPVSFALTSRRRIQRILSLLCPSARRAGNGRPKPVQDPAGISLLYGHLAKALAMKANEVRFEPRGGALQIRYRIGRELSEQGREPLEALFPLAARARLMLGDAASETANGALGTIRTAIKGQDFKLDVAIIPGREGESVVLKLLPMERDTADDPSKEEPKAKSSDTPSMDVASLLLFTREADGSDLHLSAGAPPMVRVRGEMRRLTMPDGKEAPALQPDEVRRIVLDVLTDAQNSRLEAEREIDFSLTLGPGARFRGNVFYQDRGAGAVFRVIPTEIKTCDQLGLPPVIKGLAGLEKGLLLCTGPTGSGKSTTLAAVLDQINSTRRGHILTIEDPIEFVHAPKLCMVNQREIGPNTHGFAKALRSALREDPDVILVGELRDLETISLAITAAETGHLVLGTLHTSSAAKTVDRMIDVFPAGEQGQIRSMLADSLQAIIAQILLPRKGGKGRVAAHEILTATTGVRALIRDGKTHQLPSAIQTGARYGMQGLQQTINGLSVRGVIDPNVATRKLVSLGLTRDDSPGSLASPPGQRGGVPPTIGTTKRTGR